MTALSGSSEFLARSPLLLSAGLAWRILSAGLAWRMVGALSGCSLMAPLMALLLKAL